MRTQHRKHFGGILAFPFLLALLLPISVSGQISVTTLPAPVQSLTIPDLDYVYATTPKWLFTITMASPNVIDSAVMVITLDVQLAEGLYFPNAGRFESKPFSIPRQRTVTNLELGRPGGIPQAEVRGYIFDEGAKAKFLEIALPSGTMPAGSYRFTVVVTDRTGASGTSEFTFVLTNPSSPVLLAPAEGETVSDEFPLFEWQYDGSRARIDVYEQLPGQRSLEETASGTSHASATVSTRSFRYPVTGARALRQGKTYVWVVTGLVGAAGGTSLTQRSALRSFTVTANKRFSQSWIIDELERSLPTSYKPIFDQIRAQNLSASGTFRLNGFPISVTDLLNVLNEIRSNPESVAGVEFE
jgi:hypothetical protein